MTLADISERYMPYSVRESTAGYIAPVLGPLPALRYVADCLEAGHHLLGLSGFHHHDDGSIQPDQAFEADAEDYPTASEFLGRVGGLILGQFGTNTVFEVAFQEG